MGVFDSVNIQTFEESQNLMLLLGGHELPPALAGGLGHTPQDGL
jgi:hypothetical protein